MWNTPVASQVFAPFAGRARMGYVHFMRGYLSTRMFMAAGVFGLLAGGALAAPPAANNGKIAAQTNAAVAPPLAAPALQPVAPIGGAFTPGRMGGAQGPIYFGPSPTVMGDWFGPAPLGGTFQAGPIGGTINGQNPPGGRLTGVLVGGANYPGFSPGGALSGQPSGGQYGPNLLGEMRTPNNSFTAGPSGVIVGGAQNAGASPGGVLVGGASPGGVLVGGTSQGGVLVGGASPGGVLVGGASHNTTLPGGTLTNAPGGQLH